MAEIHWGSVYSYAEIQICDRTRVSHTEAMEGCVENADCIFQSETIKDHCGKAEKRIDVIVALENLVLDAKLGLLDKIPKKEHSGYIWRHLNDLNKVPPVAVPKKLPADRSEWAIHLQTFFRDFSSISAKLDVRLKREVVVGREEIVCTRNVYKRGVVLVNAGYVAQVSFGKDHSNGLESMVFAKVFPRMKLDGYYAAVRMSSGNPLSAFCCSCTNGFVFLGCLL